MARFLFPLEVLIRFLQREEDKKYLFLTLAGVATILALLTFVLFIFRKYFGFISKSLLRNKVRTALAGLAIMFLVLCITPIWSLLMFLEIVMTEQSSNFKAIVTERYQIPSLLPWSYARTLEEGAARDGHPEDVRPDNSMTWQFVGGTLDGAKRTRESEVFIFAMDARKIRNMMDDLENFDVDLVEKLANKKNGILLGPDYTKMLNKRIGDRFILTSFNYRKINFEFEIVGELPKGRYNRSAIMNRQFVLDSMDAYKRSSGQDHPMLSRTLNLVWLRVSTTEDFQRMADQIVTSSNYTSPAVKCETGSSGISSFLDAYRDMIWAVKWLLVPAILFTMSLVIATAISIGVRERRAELAVLKVLGYPPLRIMLYVLGEAILVGAIGGFLGALVLYLPVKMAGGIPFQMAFFPKIELYPDTMWWGMLFGAFTSFIGSFIPALNACRVKVSEVFAKIG